jgi:predicted phage tail protein
LAISISPPFVRYTRWVDTPQAGMTTFHFASATADQASTVVRLLNFAEQSGESPSRVSMAASAEVASSLLLLTFDHFNDTLLFDPGRRCLGPCSFFTLLVAVGC